MSLVCNYVTSPPTFPKQGNTPGRLQKRAFTKACVDVGLKWKNLNKMEGSRSGGKNAPGVWNPGAGSCRGDVIGPEREESEKQVSPLYSDPLCRRWGWEEEEARVVVMVVVVWGGRCIGS